MTEKVILNACYYFLYLISGYNTLTNTDSCDGQNQVIYVKAFGERLMYFTNAIVITLAIIQGRDILKFKVT